MWPLVRFNVIGDAWRLYRRHWVVWSLAMLIVLIGSSLVIGAVFEVLAINRPGGRVGFRLPSNLGLSALEYILSTVIAGFFVGGLRACDIAHCLFERADPVDAFGVTRVKRNGLLKTFDRKRQLVQFKMRTAKLVAQPAVVRTLAD